MVKALADYARLKEIQFLKEGIPDPESGEIIDRLAHDHLTKHFPDPWPQFRHELEARLKTDDLNALREDMARLGSYSAQDLQQLRTLFVSRAPQHRKTPALHESTIRSSRLISNSISIVSTPLTKLKLSTLDSIVESHGRNKQLVEALRLRLSANSDNAVKAFAEPFYKPTANGKVAPIVRAVKVQSTQRSGAFVNGGVAELGEMVSVHLYQIPKGYFVSPRYQIAIQKRVNPSDLPVDAQFLFEIAKNDLISVEFGETTVTGYFVMYETDGRLTLRAHDQPKPDKNFFRKSIASATKIRKFNVDILGRIHATAPETHRGLA